MGREEVKIASIGILLGKFAIKRNRKTGTVMERECQL
jgi:hypothetical protein